MKREEEEQKEGRERTSGRSDSLLEGRRRHKRQPRLVPFPSSFLFPSPVTGGIQRQIPRGIGTILRKCPGCAGREGRVAEGSVP